MSIDSPTQENNAHSVPDATQPDPRTGETLRPGEVVPAPGGPPVPIAQVAPVVRQDGLWPQVVALAKYMVQTEVHTYAFSVAANVILSLFPFIVMMLTISQVVFHSDRMFQVVIDSMYHFLPANQAFIMKNMKLLVHPNKGMQVYSVAMLLISCTGVFLPLEVALNGVWGVRKNRSYLMNQMVSIGLAFLIGLIAMASVAITASERFVLPYVFFQHIDNGLFRFVSGILDGGLLDLLGVVVGVTIFFLIYWILPNRKVPARAVLPTAIVIGLLWEVAKYLYQMALPRLDFVSVYGPFFVSVSLMIWAFLSGLLLLAGAHFSATRYALAVARKEERERLSKEQGAVDAPESAAHA
jgi:YihY family inner membrane protein